MLTLQLLMSLRCHSICPLKNAIAERLDLVLVSEERSSAMIVARDVQAQPASTDEVLAAVS
jgi:hypothetical protein